MRERPVARGLSGVTPFPNRRTALLHRGRSSEPGARYFLTCCTHGRCRGLISDAVLASLRAAWLHADGAGTAHTLAAVAMPDHVHWLIELGPRVPLGQVVGRFKRLTGPSLAGHGLAWQRDFFDHRLRADEAEEAYALYLYLNPWRGVQRGEVIGADPSRVWWTPQPERWLFLRGLDPDGRPPPEWLQADPPWKKTDRPPPARRRGRREVSCFNL